MRAREARNVLILPAILLASACVGRVGPNDDSLSEAAPAREERASAIKNEPAEGLPTPGAVPNLKGAPGGAQASEATPCADITDEAALRAAYEGPKVPLGYYVDEPEKGAWPTWGEGCAIDLKSAREIALEEAKDAFGYLSGAERTTPYFYEVDIALSGGAFTQHFRMTKCDYFDGSTLGGGSQAPSDDLAELAVYLWYSTWATTAGAVIAASSAGESGDSATYTLCEARTTFGECGVCDTVALLQSTYVMTEKGAVALPGEAKLTRTILGQCDEGEVAP